MMLACLQADELAGFVPEQLVRTCVQPRISMTQLAFYCAAAGVTDPIHYDRAFARQSGFADAVVNGSLRVAWMAQALHELVLPRGWLTRLQCSHRGVMLVGEVPCLEMRYRGHTSGPDGTHVELAMQTLVGERACDTGDGTVFIPPAIV